MSSWASNSRFKKDNRNNFVCRPKTSCLFKKDNRTLRDTVISISGKKFYTVRKKPPDSRKTEVCKYFLEGKCTKPHCPYSHIARSNRFSVCQEFLLNKFCPRGSKCVQRHVTNASKRPSSSQSKHIWNRASSLNKSQKMNPNSKRRLETQQSDRTATQSSATDYCNNNSFLLIQSEHHPIHNIDLPEDDELDFLKDFLSDESSILPSFLQK